MKIVRIKISDIGYYPDNFEYPEYYIIDEENEEFTKKLKRLKLIAETYEDFDEIPYYIKNNFTLADVSTFNVEV